VRRPIGTTGQWVLGLAVGATATLLFALVPTVGFIVYAALGIVLMRVGRLASLGGLLFATGVWFAYFQYQQIANCDAFNAHGGTCQMGETITSDAIVLAFVAAGAALSVYALARVGKRSVRGGE
jgi:hypothetical protein